MVGTIAKAGSGRWSVADVRAALEARDRARCGPMAPPAGLYLVGVEYGEPMPPTERALSREAVHEAADAEIEADLQDDDPEGEGA